MGPDQVFAPSRLTVARERRGLNRKSLAAMVGVTPPAITEFEAAEATPLPTRVQRMAMAMQFPPAWFYAADLDLINPNAPSFRARVSMPAGVRMMATRSGDIAASVIAPELQRRFRLPACDLPDLSDHTPGDAAGLLRDQWRLGYGPIGNLVHLLEAHGVQIYWLHHDSTKLDAWSMWHGERPFVLLNTAKPAGDRARFDLAHELGHLVLHRGEKIEGLPREKEADAFAGAFLLAESQFRIECPKYPVLNAFLQLKPRWGVSVAAMLVRGKELGIYHEKMYYHAFKELERRQWRKGEPLSMSREESQLHQKMFDLLAVRGISAETFARDLLLDPQDIYELMPQAAHYVRAAAAPGLRTTGRGYLRKI